MGTSNYTTAVRALMEGAQTIGYPDLDGLQQSLTTDVPAKQFQALVEGVRNLAAHTQRDGLVGTSPIFTEPFSADNAESTQVKCVTRVAKKVPGLVKIITKQDTPAEDNEPPPQLETDRRKQRRPAKSGQSSDRRPTGAQKLRIIHWPRLRKRLIQANLWAECRALEPPVDLANQERYPPTERAAQIFLQRTSDQEFAAGFDDLQRAATALLQCPHLDEANGLNHTLATVLAKHQEKALLGHVPADSVEILERLLSINADYERLLAMMGDDTVTVSVVGDVVAGYKKMVAAKVQQAAAPQREVDEDPPAKPEAQPANGEEGGNTQLPPSKLPARPTTFDRPADVSKPVPGSTGTADKPQKEEIMAVQSTSEEKPLAAAVPTNQPQAGQVTQENAPTQAADAAAPTVPAQTTAVTQSQGNAGLQQAETENQRLRAELARVSTTRRTWGWGMIAGICAAIFAVVTMLLGGVVLLVVVGLQLSNNLRATPPSPPPASQEAVPATFELPPLYPEDASAPRTTQPAPTGFDA